MEKLENNGMKNFRSIPWEVDNATLSNSYVAGFFDGDGSMCASIVQQSELYRFRPRVRLKINFTQHIRHKPMLEALQKFLGGYGAIRTIEDHHLAELVIQNRSQIIPVLERLYPHLLLKKEQVRLALEIFD